MIRYTNDGADKGYLYGDYKHKRAENEDKESGRMVKHDNRSPQQPPRAQTGHESLKTLSNPPPPTSSEHIAKMRAKEEYVKKVYPVSPVHHQRQRGGFTNTQLMIIEVIANYTGGGRDEHSCSYWLQRVYGHIFAYVTVYMSREAWAVMGMKRSTDPSEKTLINSEAAAKHQHEEYEEGKGWFLCPILLVMRN
nr:hypothetical protein [Tanacetum cinerariifolium]GEX31551.1 hypothetical protein [Tanacetum cinerariifolium]